jgi:hypothetical protein
MKILLLGATGMVGQGVLYECLRDSDVDQVISIGRRATGRQYEKLHEIVQADLRMYAYEGTYIRRSSGMSRKATARKQVPQELQRPKKLARTFRLTPGKVEAAQRILGSSTATDAIETALDMVVFRRELIEGTEAAFGIRIASPERKSR